MAQGAQLDLDWTAPPAPPKPVPECFSRANLGLFVERVREAGIRPLRQLKALVDSAVVEDELEITDEDVPF